MGERLTKAEAIVATGKKGKPQKRRNQSKDSLLAPADVTFSNMNPIGAKARLDK